MSTELQQVTSPRIIQVFFNGQAINIATNSTKWSEIVPLIQNHEDGFDLLGKKAVLGSSKGILQLPDAEIPLGNQAIFLVQDKMKSGVEKATKPFEDLSYVDLRRLVRDKGLNEGLGSNPTRKVLIEILNTSTKIKEIKGSTKVAKEQKVAIIKQVNERVVELTPDVSERIQYLEDIIGTMIEGFGTILDGLRGKGFIIVKEKVSNIVSTLVENKVTLKEENNKVKTTEELQREFNNIKF